MQIGSPTTGKLDQWHETLTGGLKYYGIDEIEDGGECGRQAGILIKEPEFLFLYPDPTVSMSWHSN